MVRRSERELSCLAGSTLMRQELRVFSGLMLVLKASTFGAILLFYGRNVLIKIRKNYVGNVQITTSRRS